MMKTGKEMVINSDKEYEAKRYATGKERGKDEDKNVGE
jgi:hypothetical protein